MATTTANKKYTYEKVYYNKPLSEWVLDVHKHLSKINGWKYYPIKKGAFGYDNLVHSLSWVFLKCDKDTDLDRIADCVHKGWIVNYVYWRDNEPWKEDKTYFKPGNELNDERRNLCAVTPYAKLEEEEKKKDIDIAIYLQKILKNNY